MTGGADRVRVWFDLSIVPHALGGVSRYLLSLWKALETTASEHGIDVLPMDVPAAHPGVPGPIPGCTLLPDPLYLRIPLFRRIPIRNGWEERTRAERLAGLADGCDIFHHSGVQPCHPEGSISVLTIYDLSALEHPEWHTSDTVRYARRELALLSSGSAAAAISGWTSRQAVDVLGLPTSRVRSIGGAADDIFTPGEPDRAVMAAHGLTPGGYLLHVGNFVPRKNVPFLLETYSTARSRHGLSLPLVMVGAGGWGGVEASPGDGLKVLRGIPDGELLQLYRGARALLLPSCCEGLGLPVLEALACGTPVIASNAAAIPETLGNAGVLVEAGDTETWLSELTSIEGEERYRVLKELALDASLTRPRWADVAGDLCCFYRELAGR